MTVSKEPNFTWFARAVVVAALGTMGLIGWNIYAREVTRIDRIELRQSSLEERAARVETKVDTIKDDVKDIKGLLQRSSRP